MSRKQTVKKITRKKLDFVTKLCNNVCTRGERSDFSDEWIRKAA